MTVVTVQIAYFCEESSNSYRPNQALPISGSHQVAEVRPLSCLALIGLSQSNEPGAHPATALNVTISKKRLYRADMAAQVHIG